MRVGSAVAAIALVAVPATTLASCLRSDIAVGPTPTATAARPPSAPSGLVVTLTTERESYGAADPVEFAVEICNHGTETVRALGGFSLDVAISTTGGVDVTHLSASWVVDAEAVEWSPRQCQMVRDEALVWSTAHPFRRVADFSAVATVGYPATARDGRTETHSAPVQFTIEEVWLSAVQLPPGVLALSGGTCPLYWAPGERTGDTVEVSPSMVVFDDGRVIAREAEMGDTPIPYFELRLSAAELARFEEELERFAASGLGSWLEPANVGVDDGGDAVFQFRTRAGVREVRVYALMPAGKHPGAFPPEVDALEAAFESLTSRTIERGEPTGIAGGEFEVTEGLPTITGGRICGGRDGRRTGSPVVGRANLYIDAGGATGAVRPSAG